MSWSTYGPAGGREVVLFITAEGAAETTWVTWYGLDRSAITSQQLHPLPGEGCAALLVRLMGLERPQGQLF